MPSEAAESTPFATEGVRGFLHRPAAGGAHGLVVTHGAGSNCQTPLLIAVARAFCEAGVSVLRCDLPFRQRRPTGPPTPATAKADRDGLLKAVEALRPLIRGRLFLGGHSYGGRQASMLAAEAPDVADGLLLLSYPLHPPAKPAQMRTAHFANLSLPCLFVHGANDPFGATAELTSAIEAIAGEKQLLVVEGAGHDLKRGRFDLTPVVAALLEVKATRSAPPPAPR